MRYIIHQEYAQKRQPPWAALLSFGLTVITATIQRWSAEDLAWSFWLSGLVFGFIYLVVYHAAQRDNEAWGLYFLLFLFYLIFAAFLDAIFSLTAFDTAGARLRPLFADAPVAIARAARQRWSFLLFSGLTLLPDYILDARTVHFTNLSKPLFAKDLLRMIALIFLLVPLTLARLGVFALYPVLLVYFLPWESVRQIVRWLFQKGGP
ncbi:MAG: hypothetical protein H5T68_02710 [Chloroflexi bacterium]|nr:hypothetical protein [Chloroflexota bacterium]